MTSVIRRTLAAVAVLCWLGSVAEAQTTTTFVSGPGWTVTNASGPAGSSVDVCLATNSPANCPPGAVNWGFGGGWGQDLSPIPGATWIWAPGLTGASPASLQSYTFSRTISVAGTPTAGTVYMTADDYVELRVNGSLVDTYGSVTNIGSSAAGLPLRMINVLPFLVTGANVISVTAVNGPDSFPGVLNAIYAENPAGVVFGGAITFVPTTTMQPPTGLYAAAIDSDSVTLRWTPPAAGPTPTSYVIKGGVAPGQTMAAVGTGGPSPIIRLSVARGAFFVRVHAVAGGIESAASNEIPLVVGTPRAPSAPAELLGAVDGSTVSLSWRPTLEGGPATSYLLDVGGFGAITLPLPLSGRAVTFRGVAPGTYTLRLRAVNASGTSEASNPITLTTPSAACAVPQAPRELSAVVTGKRVSMFWEAPVSGAAVDRYLVRATGAGAATFTTLVPRHTGNAPSGVYQLYVAAANACGVGPESGPFAVIVP